VLDPNNATHPSETGKSFLPTDLSEVTGILRNFCATNDQSEILYGNIPIEVLSHINRISVEQEATLPGIEKYDDSQSATLTLLHTYHLRKWLSALLANI
jgi:hypothetical protein